MFNLGCMELLILLVLILGLGYFFRNYRLPRKAWLVLGLIGLALLFALMFRAMIDEHGPPPAARVLAFLGMMGVSGLFIWVMLRLFAPDMPGGRVAAYLSSRQFKDALAQRLPVEEVARRAVPLAARIGRLPILAVLLSSLPLALLAFIIAVSVWPPRRPDEFFAGVFGIGCIWTVFFAGPFSLTVWLCRWFSRNDCPEVGQLKALLADRLPASEQARLTMHLEGCAACQHRLEGLTAGQKMWGGLAGRLSEQPPSPDPALRKVMERLKEDNEETGGEEPVLCGDLPLGFLSPSDKPGQLGRLERYEVLEEVGRGGMGIVFKAFDPTLHRVVAIKVLAPQLATSGVARKRFLREAKAAAAVTHDHIVTIHAVEEANGLPYLVMQYVAGQSLQDRIDKEGPLELADVVRIGMQTASGLAAAHGHGIVHRDIKPANILLEEGVGRVKLTDFGLARAMDDASLTQSGFVAGSPLYMAPEQARGEALDHRADLFSLGSVLYTMCTGRPPFRAANTLAVLRRVSEDAPRPIRETNPEIPDWLSEVVDRLMAKHPEDRFASAAEVVDVLGHHLAQLQGAAWSPPPAAAGHVPEPGLPTSVTLCPSCGASLHVPERMVGSVVHCFECGKAFHVEEGSEVIQVARPMKPPLGPAFGRRRRRVPGCVWVAACALLPLLLLLLLWLSYRSAQRQQMLAQMNLHPPATVETRKTEALPRRSGDPFWKNALGWLPPEATCFGVIDLKPFGSITLDDPRTQDWLRAVMPEQSAGRLTPENLGRIRLDGVALAFYEGRKPEDVRAIVHLDGLALDGRKPILDFLRRESAEKLRIEENTGNIRAIRVSSAALPFALGIYDDNHAFLASSRVRDAGAEQHRKALMQVNGLNFSDFPVAGGNVLTGYNPPWLRNALNEVPPDACGLFLGEIPAELRKLLCEALQLRGCPRSFVCHLRKEGDSVAVSLTLNLDKAGTEQKVTEDLEKWRRQAVDVLRVKYPALRKEPQALAQIGQALNGMRWEAHSSSVRTRVRINGATWKALLTLLKRASG